MCNDTEYPAHKYRHLLKPSTYTLLNILILDYKSTLPPDARVHNKEDNASLIYNLFKGNYEFSYRQFKEILECLTNNI